MLQVIRLLILFLYQLIANKIADLSLPTLTHSCRIMSVFVASESVAHHRYRPSPVFLVISRGEKLHNRRKVG